MALSEGFRRLFAFIGPDIDKMLARQQQRLGSFDRVEFDGSLQNASVWRGGSLLWRGKAESIGFYSPSFGLLRWWWHGRSGAAIRKGRLDTVLDEARKHNIRELSTDSAEVTTEADARQLSNLVAQLARAEGVLRIESEEYGVQFLAMFEPAERSSTRELDSSHDLSKYSVAAPPPSLGQPLATAKSRVQTITGAAAPITAMPVREPTREVIAPLITAALATIAELPKGFVQALLTVVVEMRDNKGRFTVQVVALDPQSELVALDTSKELSDATAKMIADDARSGNGRWGKLVVRLRRTTRGASVELTVHA